MRIDQEIRSELISFPEMIEGLEHCEGAIDQQHVLELSRLFERDQNPTVFVGIELTLTEHDSGRRHMLTFGVDNPYQLPCIADRKDRRELTFLNQGATALASGQELDDPYPLPIEFW